MHSTELRDRLVALTELGGMVAGERVVLFGRRRYEIEIDGGEVDVQSAPRLGQEATCRVPMLGGELTEAMVERIAGAIRAAEVEGAAA